MSARLCATSWREPSTRSIRWEPCCVAVAWDRACRETCSTEEESSSTEALVCSSVDAWLCAPSARDTELDAISALAVATSAALWRMAWTRPLRLSVMTLMPRERLPTSSRLWTAIRDSRSPSEILRAASAASPIGLVMLRAMRSAGEGGHGQRGDDEKHDTDSRPLQIDGPALDRKMRSERMPVG